VVGVAVEPSMQELHLQGMALTGLFLAESRHLHRTHAGRYCALCGVLLQLPLKKLCPLCARWVVMVGSSRQTHTRNLQVQLTVQWWW